MSVVCDDYLVPTVDAICDYFRIPEDVAGATLVAFACNGPELLTNVCGIFVTKTSVGMGTVVGSAIFNVLVITGACPMVSPLGKLRVCKRRFLRDVLFSAISIVMLWWALPVVDLFKASALFGMSAVYALVVAKSDAWLGPAGQETSALENALLDSGASSESEGCKPETCKPIVGAPFEGDKPLAGAPFAGDGAGQEAPGFAAARLVSALSDIASRPIDFVLALTVPDLKAYNVSVPRMLVAFFSSMAWLSGTAYVVCLGSDAINRHWGVPQAFLGLTLVAVGTSWPNLMASVVTARAGRGAIAVSNALGSNVQNVFLVLAGPIWVSVLLNGDYVADGADILASVLWMGITLAFVAAAVAFEGFRLTSMAGWSFMVLYAAYLVQATLLA
uniref:Sodium/calcium exchanger membrane region domain-containing protein n=1 Tax=Zooxanthella nutricula TaxID=1333877 RepID=A0A7S2MZK5_9DINO